MPARPLAGPAVAAGRTAHARCRGPDGAARQGGALRARLPEPDPGRTPARCCARSGWPGPRAIAESRQPRLRGLRRAGPADRPPSATASTSAPVSRPIVEVSESTVAPALRAGRRRSRPQFGDAAPGGRAGRAVARGAGRPAGLGARARLTAPNTVGILEGTDPEAQERVSGLLRPHGPHRHHAGPAATASTTAPTTTAPAPTGVIELAEAFSRPGARPEALDHLPHRERRGEGALGQPLLQRAPAGADRPDRGRPQHRHDRPQLAGHDRGDREGALGPRRHARAGEPRPTPSSA